MIKDLTGQGGIILFLTKTSSLYAIEGSSDLAKHLTMLFNKDYLNYLAGLKQKNLNLKLNLIIKSY